MASEEEDVRELYGLLSEWLNKYQTTYGHAVVELLKGRLSKILTNRWLPPKPVLRNSFPGAGFFSGGYVNMYEDSQGPEDALKSAIALLEKAPNLYYGKRDVLNRGLEARAEEQDRANLQRKLVESQQKRRDIGAVLHAVRLGDPCCMRYIWLDRADSKDRKAHRTVPVPSTIYISLDLTLCQTHLAGPVVVGAEPREGQGICKRCDHLHKQGQATTQGSRT